MRRFELADLPAHVRRLIEPPPKRLARPAMTAEELRLLESEKTFMQKVIDLALSLGWLCYHTFNSQRSSSGFFDLVLVRRGVLVIAECKKLGGTLSPAQRVWKAALEQVPGIIVRVWDPTHWNDIEYTLTTGRAA